MPNEKKPETGAESTLKHGALSVPFSRRRTNAFLGASFTVFYRGNKGSHGHNELKARSDEKLGMWAALPSHLRDVTVSISNIDIVIINYGTITFLKNLSLPFL